jgi:hypothetical protein
LEHFEAHIVYALLPVLKITSLGPRLVWLEINESLTMLGMITPILAMLPQLKTVTAGDSNVADDTGGIKLLHQKKRYHLIYFIRKRCDHF